MESNHRPTDYESAALTAELPARRAECPPPPAVGWSNGWSTGFHSRSSYGLPEHALECGGLRRVRLSTVAAIGARRALRVAPAPAQEDSYGSFQSSSSVARSMDRASCP